MSEKITFCPNCGAPLKGNVAFCPNCGWKLKKAASVKPAAPNPAPVQTTKTPRQPMSKKKKTILTIVGVVLASLVGFYIWGHNYYSTTNQVNRITTKLANPNQDLSPYVTCDDDSVKITKESVKPLQEYYQDHRLAVIGLNTSLRTGIGNSHMSLVKKGNYWLIFPKYQLLVKTYRPQVTTNHENSTVKVNGKNVGSLADAEGSYTKKLGPMLPGKYQVTVNTKVAGRNLTANTAANVWSDKTIDMDIATQTFSVKSVPNGVVYINDKKVGTLNSKGKITFNSYPITKNMDLYVAFNNNGKTIKSETVADLGTAFEDAADEDYDDDDTVTETDDGYQVEPEWKGVISDDDAKALLDSAFSDPDADDFVDGADNKDYTEIKTMNHGWDHDDKIDDYDTDVSIESIYPASDTSCSVVFKVTYTFDHDDDTRTQVVEFTGGIIQTSGDNPKIKTIGNGKKISDKTSSDD